MACIRDIRLAIMRKPANRTCKGAFTRCDKNMRRATKSRYVNGRLVRHATVACYRGKVEIIRKSKRQVQAPILRACL